MPSRYAAPLCALLLAAPLVAPPAAAQSGYPIAIGGSGTDRLVTVAADAQRNVVVGGYFNRNLDVDPGPGEVLLPGSSFENGFLASYTPAGALRFAVQIAGGGFQEVTSVAADDAGAIAVGFFAGTVDFDASDADASLTAEQQQLFVAAYDGAGVLRYAFAVDGPEVVQEAFVAIGADGHTYVTGSLPRGEAPDFDPGPGETVLTPVDGTFEVGFLASYTSDGALRWAVLLEGPGLLRPRDVAARPGGGVVLTGSFQGTIDFDTSDADASLTSAGSADAFVAAYGTDGALALAYQVGGTGFDSGDGVAVDAANRTALVGTFQGTVDFDPGPDTVDFSATGGTAGDGFVALYGGDGALVFARDLDQAPAVDVALGPDGAPTIAGAFEDTVVFGAPSGASTLTSAGGRDAYAVTYEADGSVRYAAGVGSPTGNDVARGVVLDGVGGALLAGQFVGTADFDPGAGAATLTAQGVDGFVTRLTPAGALPIATEPLPDAPDAALQVWPSPAQAGAPVRLRGLRGPARVVLVDLLGRTVAVLFDGVATGDLAVRLPAGLAPGTYALRTVRADAIGAVLLAVGP